MGPLIAVELEPPRTVPIAPPGVDLADAIVAGVGNVECARTVDRETGRVAQERGGGRAALTSVARLSGAGNCGDLSVRRQSADAMAFELRDVKRAGIVDRQVARREQARLSGGSAVG